MVIYDAKRRKVDTIDSRETAPAGLTPDAFERATRADFQAARVERPQRRRPRHRARLGDRARSATARARCARCCGPASGSPDEGFVVDQTFADQVTGNVDVFDDFTSSRETLPDPGGHRAGRRLDPSQPGHGRDLRAHRARTRTASTPAASRATSRAPCSSRPRQPDSDRRVVRPRVDDHARPGALRAIRASRRRSATAGSTSTAWARRPPAARRSARRSTSSRASRRSAPSARRRCTATSRPPSSPTRTATSISATPKYVDVPLRGLLSDGFAAERALADHRHGAAGAAGPRRPVAVRQGGHGQAAPEARSSGRRGQVDDPPDGRRPLGQRRLLHVHDRADRRQRHRRPGPRLPAQQRADRLQLHADPDEPPANSPAAGQAPALEHGADDRLRPRAAGGRARLAGRRDDHHHRAAGPGPPHRLRARPARRGRGAAGVAAQQRRRRRPSRRSSSATETSCRARARASTGTR